MSAGPDPRAVAAPTPYSASPVPKDSEDDGRLALEILVVEDNPGDYELVRVALSSSDAFHFQLTRASSLREALALVEDQSFDLALVDLHLPDSDGLATVEPIRAAAPDTAIVVLTVNQDPELERQLLRGIVEDYLVKQEVGPMMGRLLYHAVERRRLADASRRAEQRLRRAVRLQSLAVMAGGIAHDFNNLLMGVLANTELAMKEVGSAKPLSVYLGRVDSCARRAATLTHQILAYAGGHWGQRSPVDLEAMIRELVPRLETDPAPARRLVLELQPELKLTVNSAQLEQALVELVGNAVEAMPDAAGSILIRTAVRHCDHDVLETPYLSTVPEAGQYVEIAVSDDGEGMGDETLEHLFDPFYTTRFEGRGLGLAGVLGFVRSHGGVIRVDSEIGAGTRMTMLLPVEAPQ